MGIRTRRARTRTDALRRPLDARGFIRRAFFLGDIAPHQW
jgi:hypothetical protein